MLDASERLGDSLGRPLSDTDTIGFPEGEELGAFDNEDAQDGSADERLGWTDGVVLGAAK